MSQGRRLNPPNYLQVGTAIVFRTASFPSCGKSDERLESSFMFFQHKSSTEAGNKEEAAGLAPP